jgi:hypothetical protein
MNLVYLDIETTGLDTNAHQIVEIGAIADGGLLWDKPIDQLPQFQCFVRHAMYHVDPYCIPAMAQRADALKTKGLPVMEALESLIVWMQKAFWDSRDLAKGDQTVVLCGKNVGSFDYQFFKPLGIGCKMREYGLKLSHRFFDVGSMMVNIVDIKSGVDMPQLSECLGRLGLPNHVPHTALEDALLVAKCVRACFGNYIAVPR